MKHAGFVVVALLTSALAAGPAVPAPEGDGIFAVERLPWSHWGLELYLWEVSDAGERVRFRFLLQLKPETNRAWTSVGYARYRTATGRWNDAVSRGIDHPSRLVEVAVEGSDHVVFSVVVPRSASIISLPVGDLVVQLETEEWFSLLDEGGVPRETAVGFVGPTATRDAAAAPGRPARLVAGLRWDGAKPFGDGALEAEEHGELLVDVFNQGERIARDVAVRISADGAPDVVFPAEVPVAEVEPGGSRTVRVPFRAGPDAVDATVPVSIRVVEPYGHDAAPIEFELTTRAVDPPVLVLTDDFAVDGAELPIRRDHIVTLHLRVRNIGQGTARDVVAEVASGADVFPAHDSATRFELGDLAPGEVGQLDYRCYANQRAEKLELRVYLAHARSTPGGGAAVLTLPLDSADSAPRIVRVTPDPRAPAGPLSPPPPPLTSDVDRQVPQVGLARPKGLAVVLGVERYYGAPPATYAAGDARTAARYFEHALGIPPERIELLLDEEVTLARMQRVFARDGWLARRVHEDSEVFVYFAGHGVTESEAFDPYLVPSDGDLGYVRQTALSLDTVIERLASLDAGRVTVFLDACFSGLTREGGALLAGARRLTVVPVYRGLSGVSVFSAARGSQTAHALDEQGHGLFSYFLFKGLGGAADLDHDRRVTSGELRFFLESEVPRAAALIDREQTPAIFLDDEQRVLVPLP